MKTKWPSLGTMIGWLVLSIIYLSTLPTVILPLIILGAMGFSWWAYEQDKEREKVASDDFKEMGLLFRYGYEINDVAVPVFVDLPSHQIDDLVRALTNRLYSTLQDAFANLNMVLAFPVVIKDKEYPEDQREFLKMVMRTSRGSQLSHFIHFAVTGKYIVTHFTTKVRGRYEWYNVVNFILLSPITVWFWGVDWWKNQYSIVASISTTVGNSYDLIDLTSYFQSTYLMVWRVIRDFLKEKDLLSDDVQQIIINNITNTQQISVSKSRQVNLGNIINRVQSAVPRIAKE